MLAAGAECSFAITSGSRATTAARITSTSSRRRRSTTTTPTPRDNDDATVDFTNVAPTIDVTKTANPTAVPETGGNVTFTFTVKNTSTEEPVTITSLNDSVYGTLAGDADCQVGTVLAAGAECSFSITRWVEGDFSGPDHVNVFTAHADDNDNTDATRHRRRHGRLHQRPADDRW